MRVTTLDSLSTRLRNLSASQLRLDEAQERVSSGKRMLRLSDSPEGAAASLALRSQIAAGTQRREQADSVSLNLKATSAALGDLGGLLRQARGIGISVSSGTVSGDQQRVLADQVADVATAIRALANTRVGSQYVFGGTRTDLQPFPTAGGYAGTNQAPAVDLGQGESFPAGVAGSDLLNTRGATDLFTNLQALENAVRSGDVSSVQGALAELDQDLSNVVRLNGQVGGRIQYLSWISDRTEADLAVQREELANLESSDLAEGILEVRQAETANEAALSIAARLGRLSLLDFLR
jgi:flagellar hook-associated protein 3 FlgL